MGISIEDAKKHIRDLGFDIDPENKYVKELIESCVPKNDIKSLEHYMKQCQNCGGYALQLPICIFSGDKYSFEEKVLRIMELYPFVRLLSDTELKDNEYIVEFRAQGMGHHFIKIDQNGEAKEKDGCGLPREFKKWDNLEDAPEAVFAVLKQEYRTKEMKDLPQCNKDMFLNLDAYEVEDEYGTYIDTKKAKKPMTFNDKLEEAYNNKKSSFIYNNKMYYLKINKDDPELIYICNEREILGEVCVDGKDFLIELNEEKKNEVFGFEPSIPIRIKEGCNENLDEER